MVEFWLQIYLITYDFLLPPDIKGIKKKEDLHRNEESSHSNEICSDYKYWHRMFVQNPKHA